MHIYIYISLPQSIKHRCLEYCYTKYIGPPSQSSIEALNTATPIKNIQVLPSQSSIKALHTSTPNKYIGPPQSIEQRCLEYCYTKQIYRSSPVN